MPKPVTVTVAISEDGEPADSAAFRAWYRALALWRGREVELTARSLRRTGRQNRYYWGVVIETIRQGRLEAGLHPVSAEDLHDHFKALYLPVRVFEVFGVTHVQPPSTSHLDSTEFYDYIESIRFDEDVLALGIAVPEPDPHYKSHSIAEP